MTLEYVNTKYPEDQWTHAYTDGSAANATRDGDGVVYNDGRHTSLYPQENIRPILKQKLKLSKKKKKKKKSRN